MTTGWFILVAVQIVHATIQSDHHGGKKMNVLYEWKTIDYTFPSTHARQAMINQGLLVPGAPFPLDVDADRERVFITTPRFKAGVPATLSTIDRHGANSKSPLLQPYPDWSWQYHKPGFCDNVLTSVFRVKIDECERLWVLDTGSVDIFTTIKQVCPRQLVIFSLFNDKMLHRHRFSAAALKTDSLLTSIVVEVRDKSNQCADTFAYVTDTTTYGLVVYDARRDRSWRVVANSFWPIPYFGHFSLSGTEFDLMDGILAVALTPNTDRKPYRTLYYHALASNTENSVSTAVLQNETAFANGVNSAMSQFRTLSAQRVGQSAAMDIATNGVMFYSELMLTSLKCFNTRLTYKGSHNPTIYQDATKFQFAAGLKIVKKHTGPEEVWVLTDRLQKLMDGTLNAREVNFRVFRGTVSGLIAGTNCATATDPVRFNEDDKRRSSTGQRIGSGEPEEIVFKED